jgi:cyclopropane-fatty-acyl-phospholipid synthase
MPAPHASQQLDATRRLVSAVGARLGARIAVELWDGSRVPLGPDVDPPLRIRVAGPDVLGTLLRRPTLENLLRQYATGGLDLCGGSLIDFMNVMREKHARSGVRPGNRLDLLRAALPLLLARKVRRGTAHAFAGDATGRRAQRDEGDFIRFHYDLGNDFYALFLDPHMQYSCAYFPEWEATLETAQEAKLDLICRKLQLQPGERLLDIGCGWGGLVCYAARHYGVSAHGVTLSPEQASYAQCRAAELGLSDRVKVELRNYAELEGSFDKIASIGMAEHVGIAGLPAYFARVRSLLRDRGLFLNHAITRRAKKSRRAFARIRPEQRLVKKYIFPGSELDHVGHSVECMEASGFEVHDVEGLREHYARTTRLWCERLTRNEERATQLVGRERYRLWVAYLAGVSFAFADGSLRIFQTVATRHKAKGASGMPPTRAHLYAGAR